MDPTSCVTCRILLTVYAKHLEPPAHLTRLKPELSSMGFSASDPGLYTADLKDGTFRILVYVVDITAVANSRDAVSHTKATLSDIFAEILK